MNLLTIRDAAFEFDNIILARNKITAVANIVRRKKVHPVVPATGKTSGSAARYDYDELEDAIIETYDKPGNNNRFRAFEGDLQNLDFRIYDVRVNKFNRRNESYLTTYAVHI